MAATASSEEGADTIVVDYWNGLGGTKTMGGVTGNYHGLQEHVLFKKQARELSTLVSDHNMINKVGRQYYHLTNLVNAGGRFFSGAVICGTLVSDHKTEGVLICRSGKLELIKADITIDATGDGDLVAFAGGKYSHGSSRTGKTQDYSQWDIITGAESFPNTAGHKDYDIIDNRKIAELQRGLFLSHYEARFYDFHPMLSVRESRRPEGLCTIDLTDAAEGTHFTDIVAQAKSDFDPHYVGTTEYTRCGFLLPHAVEFIPEIPYRTLVPKYLDGMLLTGKGISQTHLAMQFTRMSPDILVLGCMTGLVAANIVRKGIQPRDYEISEIQKEWAAMGFIPRDYATKKTGNQINEASVIEGRVRKLAGGAQEYLFECARLPEEKVLPVLFEHYHHDNADNNKILLAKALAWFGQNEGNNLIEEELRKMFDEELKQGYPGGYVDTYDDIRGREKNMLLGLYWRINQNIALLGMTGNNPAGKTIRYILENTTSGGGRVYGGDLELFIGAALARCGSKTGYDLLLNYLNDIHFNFKDLCRSELTALTGKDLGYNVKAWKKLTEGLSFPQPTRKLVKEIEV